jgi:hypothetical protein
MTNEGYDRRDERRRWSSEDDRDRRDERGFFERAGDEIASWFGDDEAERRRHEDRPSEYYGGPRERERAPRRWVDAPAERGRGGYRPVTGDYGRAERGPDADRFFSRGGGPDRDRSQGPWARDDYRRTGRAGSWDRSDRSRHEDPHYDAWRQQQIDALDRDYDDYRRENQSRFENDFGSWRERRQQKRSLLGQIREHMEVIGSDDSHVGIVDRVAGDRLVLAKSDPESGGAHHSLSCSDVDRIEGDRVILDCSAEQAKQRWRDESRSRALFEREDQGEMGPRTLDRSFEGTYRSR